MNASSRSDVGEVAAAALAVAEAAGTGDAFVPAGPEGTVRPWSLAASSYDLEVSSFGELAEAVERSR